MRTASVTLTHSVPTGLVSSLRDLPAFALAGWLVALLAAAPSQAQPCVGDCGNQGRVTVSDLVVGVNIVLENQPPSACPNFQNAEGKVDVAQLVAGVGNLLNGCGAHPTPTATPLFSGKKRTFVIAAGTPQADTATTSTGHFSSGLTNKHAASAVCGTLAAGGQSCTTPAELKLLLDDEDLGGGEHYLVLEEDATLEIGIVDGSRICLKLLADFTEGFIDCDGDSFFGIDATRPAGAPGVDFTYTRNVGPAVGAGHANLLVTAQYRIVPSTDATPCAQLGYAGQVDLPFTTATGKATVGETELELSVAGQPFSCEQFATPGSGGVLTVPIPANQPPVGDVVNALRFGERAP